MPELGTYGSMRGSAREGWVYSTACSLCDVLLRPLPHPECRRSYFYGEPGLINNSCYDQFNLWLSEGP
ncbi:hypothetical protein Psfp_04196 [Pelotomaculum sp. FP]|nr:hypothetical protein Psfp_04196 [Pelotomaculum sp. FP]